jgi:hypothetical protein
VRKGWCLGEIQPDVCTSENLFNLTCIQKDSRRASSHHCSVVSRRHLKPRFEGDFHGEEDIITRCSCPQSRYHQRARTQAYGTVSSGFPCNWKSRFVWK